MAPKPAKAAVIVKKKVWLPIIAPALFNNQQIGEVYIDEPAHAIGRTVEVSLMALTGDPQRQSTYIRFTIRRAENNQLHTSLAGFSIIPAAVRKMMRRNRERIDDSFVVKTQDNVAARVKPVLITRSKTKGSVLTHLRKQLRAQVVRAVAKLTFTDFIKELVAHKLQRQLQDALRKIYPIQILELRDVHIETSEKGLKNILTAPPAPAAPMPPAEQPPAEQPPAEPPAEQESPAPEAA